MKAITLSLLCLTALASQAHASSPDAWAAYDKTVLASCTKASGQKTPNPSARPRNSMTVSATPPCCCKANTRKNT